MTARFPLHAHVRRPECKSYARDSCFDRIPGATQSGFRLSEPQHPEGEVSKSATKISPYSPSISYFSAIEFPTDFIRWTISMTGGPFPGPSGCPSPPLPINKDSSNGSHRSSPDGVLPPSPPSHIYLFSPTRAQPPPANIWGNRILGSHDFHGALFFVSGCVHPPPVYNSPPLGMRRIIRRPCGSLTLGEGPSCARVHFRVLLVAHCPQGSRRSGRSCPPSTPCWRDPPPPPLPFSVRIKGASPHPSRPHDQRA